MSQGSTGVIDKQRFKNVRNENKISYTVMQSFFYEVLGRKLINDCTK